MKKLVFFAMSLVLILTVYYCYAEGYSAYSVEELKSLQAEKAADLTDINTAIGTAIKAQQLAEAENADGSTESLGSISSIFPDEALAMLIRDELNKFSISQPVTQAELDTMKKLNCGGFGDYQPADLTGIGYLRNLTDLDVSWQSNCVALPDEICTLTKLTSIDMDYSAVAYIPENIGDLVLLAEFTAKEADFTTLPASLVNLVNLETLDLYQTPLIELPEIGNLVNLRTLNLEQTNITALPDNIGNLVSLQTLNIASTAVSELPATTGNLINLKTLDISNTNISSLPDSIWGLQLTSLDMHGTSIK